MATSGDDIQIDKGSFVRIHYEILELLAKTPLTGGEFRCLMFLFRKTYGFNKKEDKISLSQWSEGTGMKRQNVWNLLQNLLGRNIIYCTSSGPKRAMTWGFNKYYEQWNTESVMPQHDSSEPSVMPDNDTSVMPQHDSPKTSVMPQHDKSVIPPHERTKDNKDSSKQPAAARVTSDFVSAYESIWGLTVSSDYISDEIAQWEKRVTLDGWRYALKECVDNRKHGHWKYFRRILERIEIEGYRQQSTSVPIDSTLEFALEDITL